MAAREREGSPRKKYPPSSLWSASQAVILKGNTTGMTTKEAQTADTVTPFISEQRATPGVGQRLGRLARQNVIGVIGAAIVLIVMLTALLAPLIAPYEPSSMLGRRLQPPGAKFLLGTDELGRDVFSRIVYGSRISLYVGLISVGLALALGGLVGVTAGFIGGRVDSILMRSMDILLAFPGIVLAIVIAGLLGPSTTNAMIAIGIVYTPSFARIARAAVLSVKAEPYIDAAVLIGGKQLHIVWQHILPNILAPLIVQTSLSLSTAILSEAALSFLGLGTQPPDPSWGAMLSSSRKFMELMPSLALVPGFAIMIVVLGFNFLGDGLRDALDPRLRQQ
jgi:peptide/nickel transport system permease protein